MMAEEGRFSVEVMEDDEFFPQDWPTRVNQILYENIEERIVRNNIKQLFRVLKALLSGNPQAYIPQHISLGPYHHRRFVVSKTKIKMR